MQNEGQMMRNERMIHMTCMICMIRMIRMIRIIRMSYKDCAALS